MCAEDDVIGDIESVIGGVGEGVVVVVVVVVISVIASGALDDKGDEVE